MKKGGKDGQGAVVTLPIKNNKLIVNPNITTRGFVLVNDNMELLHDLENKTKLVVENKLKNINELKSLIISELVSYIFDKTGRKPTILPVIMEIKN